MCVTLIESCQLSRSFTVVKVAWFRAAADRCRRLRGWLGDMDDFRACGTLVDRKRSGGGRRICSAVLTWEVIVVRGGSWHAREPMQGDMACGGAGLPLLATCHAAHPDEVAFVISLC